MTGRLLIRIIFIIINAMRRLALLTACLLAASCGGNQAATGSRKISVVASLYPLAFLAQ